MRSLCASGRRAHRDRGRVPVAAIPSVSVPAIPDAMPDSVMLFGFVAGALFLVRHHSSGKTSDLVLAGLALGVSFGTKWYGVSAVGDPGASGSPPGCSNGSDWRTVLRQGAAVTALVALAGGVWLLRNWVISGQPGRSP